MASCLLRLPAEDMAAFFTAVDAAARHIKTTDPDDPRTFEQVRADILADLGWSALQAGHLGCCNPHCGHLQQPMGTRRGRAATVGVTVPLSTLLGVDDSPAYLHGYGPITPDVARRLTADGTWRRLLTDPATGAPARLRHTPASARRPIWSSTSPPGIGPAGSPRAPGPRTAAMPITPSRPMRAGRPAQPTSARCTAATTTTRPTTAGGWTQPEPGRFIWTSPTGHTHHVDPEIIGPLIANQQPPDSDPPPF
jgi:hypothetical protein